MKKGEKRGIRDLIPGEPKPGGALVRYPHSLGIDWYAKKLGGAKCLIDVARLSQDRKVLEIVTLWDALNKKEREARNALEILCVQVGVSQADVLAQITKTGFTHCVDLSQLILALSQPKLTEKLVEYAEKEGGHKYMDMALKAAGRYPAPEGTKVAFLQNISASGPPSSGIQEKIVSPATPALPSFEEEAVADGETQRKIGG